MAARGQRLGGWVAAAVLAGGAAMLVLHSPRAIIAAPPRAPAARSREASAPAPATAQTDDDDDDGPALRPPSGALASLTCSAAQTVVHQLRHDLLAYDPSPVAPHDLAEGVIDWVDPHGLWASPQDSPVARAIGRLAPALLTELERGGPCTAAVEVGRAMTGWVAQLRTTFDAARARPSTRDPREALDAALADNDDMASPALARDLGERFAALGGAGGKPLAPYLDAARTRLFPDHDGATWSKVVLAAAVRAYVELVDPHGEWAPYGEEGSVYDVDLESDAPPRLWDRASRTAVGARVEGGGLPPLATGDVVLDVDGMRLGGLPVEQVDELALTATQGRTPLQITVARGDPPTVVHLVVDPSAEVSASVATAPFDLPVERVPYGDGTVALVGIHDVYDDLGDLVTRAVQDAIAAGPLEGVVLDLRGDGGGSTDGALDTVGIFLPGAPMFPMRRRDGTVETDRAADPDTAGQYGGPVAALVDVGTASAAEMIAGALQVYGRGSVIGTSTYGKGCAQEYVDDDVHAGVLRVTTLLYALPDGSAVQRVGLHPAIHFPFPDSDDIGDEREATLPNAPPTYAGPDMRGAQWLARAGKVVWPSHGAHLGPCKDPAVCKALALLGAPPRERVTARRQK